MSFSKKERELYDSRLDWLRLEEDALNKRFDDGKEEGIVIGEKKNKIEIAKKMLLDGLHVDVVAKYSGLSIEKIKLLTYNSTKK